MINSRIKDKKQLIKHPLEYFTEVTDDDIIEIVMELANKKSVLDAIPCLFFQTASPCAPTKFQCYYKWFIERMFFPTVIKMTIVTPVLKYKQLDSDILNNYRPVSNLTALPKIFEKWILKQLSDHL